MRRVFFAGLLLLVEASAAPAQIPKAPQITTLSADWNAALTELSNIHVLRQLPSTDTAAADSRLDLLTRLNGVTSRDFPGITASPLPVLLPLDLEAYVQRSASSRSNDRVEAAHLAGFQSSNFFLAGPAGYDAIFTLRLPDRPASKRSKARPGPTAEVQVSGMALLYELDGRVGGEDKPTLGLQSDIPGLRRFYFENHMRYLFTRYGVLYSVSIRCFEGRLRSKQISCRDAHAVAARFLKALTIAGGTPQAKAAAESVQLRRPENSAPTFTYHAPGQLIPGTGSRRRGGQADYTVYGTIRFPLAEAPAHVYSQLFVNTADCRAGLEPRTIRRRGAPFPCPANDKLAASESFGVGGNRYPWRDSFCERRAFFVGQCPSGLGHQGQDIVPVDCRMWSQGQDHCERLEHAVVAVHDGMVSRSPGQEGLALFVNTADAHLRFRYLHMHPKALDEDDFFSGRLVKQGETLGEVSTYSGREGGTSYHLHFDMQVPTRDGWAFVNPYMTLVMAYERLVAGHGTAIEEEIKEPATVEAERAATPVKKKPSQSKSNSAKSRPAIKQKLRTKH